MIAGTAQRKSTGMLSPPLTAEQHSKAFHVPEFVGKTRQLVGRLPELVLHASLYAMFGNTLTASKSDTLVSRR
jgi:hypothetical protein